MTRRRKNPVTVVEFEKARELVTIGPEHPFWDEPGKLKFWPDDDQQKLIRVRPPHDATPAVLNSLKTWLSTNCAGFKIEPRAPAPGVVKQEEVPRALLSPRHVIDAMIERAFTDDRNLLRQCVEEALAHGENR